MYLMTSGSLSNRTSSPTSSSASGRSMRRLVSNRSTTARLWHWTPAALDRRAAGRMGSVTVRPGLIAMTGLPGTGKSAIADAVARSIHAPVFSVDPLEATLNRASITREHRSDYAAYDLAATLAESQLRAGRSAVVDAVNATSSLRTWWTDIADRHDATAVILATICSDRGLHRARFERRTRPLDGFLYDVGWTDVEALTGQYEPADDAHLILDAVNPLERNITLALRQVERALESPP